jgi:hypothetical protein
MSGGGSGDTTSKSKAARVVAAAETGGASRRAARTVKRERPERGWANVRPFGSPPSGVANVRRSDRSGSYGIQQARHDGRDDVRPEGRRSRPGPETGAAPAMREPPTRSANGPVRRGRRKDVPNGAPAPEPGPRPKSERVIIDASNVAHSTEKTAPKLANVRLVRDRLTEDGMTPILVADAALRHQIDDPDGYEALVKAGEIQQAPAGTDADYFILSFARELDASVLSNDRFKDRIAHFPEVEERIIRYMIVAGEVVLERRAKPRARKPRNSAGPVKPVKPENGVRGSR